MTDYDAGVEKARRTKRFTTSELVDTKLLSHWAEKALAADTFITEALELIAEQGRAIEELTKG